MNSSLYKIGKFSLLYLAVIIHRISIPHKFGIDALYSFLILVSCIAIPIYLYATINKLVFKNFSEQTNLLDQLEFTYENSPEPIATWLKTLITISLIPIGSETFYAGLIVFNSIRFGSIELETLTSILVLTGGFCFLIYAAKSYNCYIEQKINTPS